MFMSHVTCDGFFVIYTDSGYILTCPFKAGNGYTNQSFSDTGLHKVLTYTTIISLSRAAEVKSKFKLYRWIFSSKAMK